MLRDVVFHPEPGTNGALARLEPGEGVVVCEVINPRCESGGMMGRPVELGDAGKPAWVVGGPSALLGVSLKNPG